VTLFSEDVRPNVWSSRPGFFASVTLVVPPPSLFSFSPSFFVLVYARDVFDGNNNGPVVDYVIVVPLGA